MFKPKQLRKDFPLLKHNPDLVYLDNAATSHKPQAVLDAVNNYYKTANANVGRGVYDLAQASTEHLENSRQKIADFFKAQPEELILTSGTTAAINGAAYGWADHNLGPDDVILISLLEHHSNLVVWQQVMQRTGAKLAYVGPGPDGQLDWDEFKNKLQNLTPKLVALSHVSNVTGAYTDLERAAQLVADYTDECRILVDGAQAVPHLPLNFSDLNIDFYAFSGHKMLGPMGTGGLLVKKELLESGEMQPWFFGGGMVEQVHQQKTKFNSKIKNLFQAGTPNTAGAVGLAAACDYLSGLGMGQVLEHDQHLVKYALLQIAEADGLLELVGPVQSVPNGKQLIRVGSVAFIPRFAQAHDTAQVLNQQNVAVRSGYHCAMPLHTYFNWPPTLRASFSVYNTKEDIDQMIAALKIAADKLA